MLGTGVDFNKNLYAIAAWAAKAKKGVWYVCNDLEGCFKLLRRELIKVEMDEVVVLIKVRGKPLLLKCA